MKTAAYLLAATTGQAQQLQLLSCRSVHGNPGWSACRLATVRRSSAVAVARWAQLIAAAGREVEREADGPAEKWRGQRRAVSPLLLPAVRLRVGAGGLASAAQARRQASYPTKRTRRASDRTI